MSVSRLQLGVGTVVTVYCLLLLWSTVVHSPTLNEPGHLVGGCAAWQFDRFDVFRVNPPLVRVVAALPVYLTGYREDWRNYDPRAGARPEFEMGQDFVRANGTDSIWQFRIARWVCLPVSLLGAWICFRWAAGLYGRGGGVLALLLWCSCPSILGHGPLLTSDLAAASFGLASCFAFWRWLRNSDWTRTINSAIILGLAELTKMTLSTLIPLWLFLWLVDRWSDAKTTWQSMRQEFVMSIARIAIALGVVNLGYGFDGTFQPLGRFQFVSHALTACPPADGTHIIVGNRFVQHWLSTLPVPLPADYVLGMDLQRRDFEHFHQPSYLHGEFGERGWWYYYLYALAIKVPLGTWLLVVLAATVGFWLTVDTSWRDEFVLLAPAVVILVFVSSQTGFSAHMRYVLPAFPFVYIWIGRLGAAFDGRHRILATVTGGALAWSIASSLWVYPHSLSYFNELVGGPTGGPAHLINSNVDWGQDLLFLQKWLDQHPEARPLKLAYFGGFDPKAIGFEYIAPEARPVDPTPTDHDVPIAPGWYAISVNFVRGLPHTIYTGDGGKRYLRQGELADFQKLKPVAMAGYSIYIYHVTE